MPDRPNIVFFAIDDLRPELNCYGRDYMITPHIDALAASSRQFSRAYCQVPVCGASRSSMFSGARPTPTRFVDYNCYTHKDHPSAVTLPRLLKDAGWHTVSRGKVFHHRDDSMDAWSEAPWVPEESFPGYRLPENRERARRTVRGDGPRQKRGPAVEIADVDDDVYPDGETAATAIGDLQRLKKLDQPFFLGVGLIRPHLPFYAPKRYWDLYDRDSIQSAPNPQPPEGVPDQALHNWGELRHNYTGIPESGPLSDDTARELIHGYRAAVSYLDAQIGRVVQAVKDEGLWDDTIIVLFVDHGWNLGEHGLWCKHCLFETSLHIPLLIRVPGVRGGDSQALVENLDIYPTLCELLQLDPPVGQLDGRSLAPILQDASAAGKEAVFSRYQRGDSVRTDRYRYSAWREDNAVTGRMLYDLQADPGENVNLAADPAMADTVAALHALLPVYEQA